MSVVCERREAADVFGIVRIHLSKRVVEFANLKAICILKITCSITSLQIIFSPEITFMAFESENL